MGNVGKPTPQVFRGKGEQTDDPREQPNILDAIKQEIQMC